MKVLSLIGDEDTGTTRLAARLGECTAVAVAPDAAARELLEAARRDGATQLIQLWDDSLGELEREPLSRELMLTAVLAALARKLELRFFVVPETPYGWLGPALAEELDLPHLSAVLQAEIDPNPQHALSQSDDHKPPPGLVVRRRCLQGVQKLRGPSVGVLCLLPDGVKPAKLPAGGEPGIDKWDLARLGLGPVDLPRPLLRVVVPERRQELRGRSFESLTALAERLRQDGLSPIQPPPPPKEVD
jgi:hypothetical protein